MKFFIFILVIFSINSQFEDVLTIDLELNANNFYRIKNIDSDLKLFFNNTSNISLMPIQYTNLIRMILRNKKILYNCNLREILIGNKEYETFFCEKNREYDDFDKLRININLNNYNISLKESELFSKEGKYYYFNFWFNDNISDFLISNNIFKKNLNKNYYIRKLESENNNNENNEKENENEKNNDNETYKNESNNKNQNKINNNSGIGWIGVCLIIILSVIVLYVVYVLFRYYRRKKYQNPSFYYKITEEMFDDITPIE